MGDGGLAYDEPMQGRLIELHCDYERGILSFVPGHTTPSRFVREMKREAVAIRGVAGEHFLKHLVRERAQGDGKLRRKLERWMGELRDELGIDGFDGQTSRIVDVFALVFAAGCLTIEYGITPWSKQRFLEAVTTVFADYDRRRRGDAEELDAKQVLSRYIERRRGDFLNVDQDSVVSNRRTLAEAAGVAYRAPDGKRQYCFMPEQFAAIFDGPLQVPNAIRQLRSSGILMVDGNDSSGVKFRPKRKLLAASRVRVYCIDRRLLAKKGTRAVRPAKNRLTGERGGPVRNRRVGLGAGPSARVGGGTNRFGATLVARSPTQSPPQRPTWCRRPDSCMVLLGKNSEPRLLIGSTISHPLRRRNG